jgi:hypothetical protein
MSTKKIIKCLFALMLAATVLLPSGSWGMERLNKRPWPDAFPLPDKRQKMEPLTAMVVPTTSFLSLSVDLLPLIFQHLTPPEKVRMGEVSKAFSKNFNSVECWKMAGGRHFSPLCMEDRTKALAKVNTLFEQTPHLKERFSDESPLTTLLYESFNTNPTYEALKYFYIYQYMKAYKGKEAAVIYLQLAAQHGHPEAIWKRLKASSKKPSEQFAREVKINFDLEFLRLGLAGHSKATVEAIRRMLDTLGWRGSNVPITAALNSNFPFRFDQIVQLLELWPEGQEHLLRRAIPPLWLNPPAPFPYQPHWVPSIPEMLISTFRNIGDGGGVTLPFEFYGSVTFKAKWPKAFCIIGEEYLKLCEKNPYQFLDMKNSWRNNAYEYFIKASSATDKKSGHLLARSVPLQEDSIPFLEKIARDFPQSAGTALAMLALIELEKIPFGALPQIETFFQTVESTYEKIIINSPSFFSTQGADKRRNVRPAIQGRKITKASSFFDWAGDKLSEKIIDISVKERFLDWVMTTPQYLYTHWVSRIIFESLRTKWGEQFVQRGILPRQHDKWNDKDTRYAREYFQYRKDFRVETGTLRGVCLTLMGIKQDDEKTFVHFFTEFCRTYDSDRSRDKLNMTNRESLQKNLDTFRKSHPKNAALPLLFAKLPFGPGDFETQLKRDYFEIAAKNGSAEAREYFKSEANKGSAEAQKFASLDNPVRG